MKKTALLCCLLLAACAAAPKSTVDQHFQSWQQRTINDMILAYGAPASQRELNGQQFAEWTRQDSSSSPSFSFGVGGFGNNVGASVGTTLFGGTKLNYCTVQAVYGSDGVISQIHWNGDTDLCLKQFPHTNK